MRKLIIILFIISFNSAFTQNSEFNWSLLKQTGGSPVIPCTATTSFLSNWLTNQTLGGWATSNYLLNRIHYDATVLTNYSKPTARVECRQNDNVACTIGDCDRDEVAEMPNGSGGLIDEANAIGTTVYYGFSYFIPADFIGRPTYWELVCQLHGPSEFGTNPLFAYFLSGDTWAFSYKSGNIAVNLNGAGVSMGAINYGHWTGFMMAVNYEKTATGSIQVWKREEGQSVFTKVVDVANVSTYQYNPAVSGGAILYHYWKQGLYRQSVSRTDVIWMGPFSRAATFLNAECGAFGTQNGPT